MWISKQLHQLLSLMINFLISVLYPDCLKKFSELNQILSALKKNHITVDSHCLEFPVESNFYRSPEHRCV